MKKNLYYAVSASGQGMIFTSRPIRDEHFNTWCGQIIGCFASVVMFLESEGFQLPNIKWSDEPVKLSLTINIE